jgi:hypothetical protein
MSERTRDGRSDPVTAENFVVSCRRILTGKLGSPYSDSLFIVRGSRSLQLGQYRDAGISYTIALYVDDHRLRRGHAEEHKATSEITRSGAKSRGSEGHGSVINDDGARFSIHCGRNIYRHVYISERRPLAAGTAA